MIAYERSESAWDNFGKRFHQFQPENKTLIKKLERILIKLYRQKVSLLLNQTRLNKGLALYYYHTYTHTHTTHTTYIYNIYIYTCECVCVCVHMYMFGWLYVFAHARVYVCVCVCVCVYACTRMRTHMRL